MSFYFIVIVSIAVLVLGFWSVIRLINPEKKAIVSFVLEIVAIFYYPFFSLLLYSESPLAETIFLFFYAVSFLILIGIVAGIMGLKSKRRNFAIVGLSICPLALLFLGHFIISFRMMG